MKKVISFSLWGDNPDYTVGAIRNMEMAEEVYPGWETRFFVHQNVPKNIVDKLMSKTTLNSVILMPPEPANSDCMFWRLSPLTDPLVEVFISRDCDSRLNDKEHQAVLEWLNSDKQFHCMRDHAYHGFPPVLGGMCGFKTRGPVDPHWIFHHVSRFKQGKYGNDQNGLLDLYNGLHGLFMEHDDSLRFKGMRFPPHKSFKYGSFIGERITHDDKPGRL